MRIVLTAGTGDWSLGLRQAFAALGEAAEVVSATTLAEARALGGVILLPDMAETAGAADCPEIVVAPFPAPPLLAAAFRAGIFDWVTPDDTAGIVDAVRRAEAWLHYAQTNELSQLRQSEERYRLVSNLVSDYVYSVRIDTPMSSTNPTEWPQHTMEWVAGAFTQVTGYQLEEIQAGISWPDLVHPEDVPAAAAFGLRLAKGETSVLEYRLRHKSGQYRWLHDICKPVWDAEQDRIVRLVGGVHDITEHKHAEISLRESRALLHAVYRAQSAFIEHADDDQVFTELLSGLLVLAECEQAIVLEHDGTDLSAHTFGREDLGGRKSATRHRVKGDGQLGRFFASISTKTPIICNGGAVLEGPPASWVDLNMVQNFTVAPLVRRDHVYGLILLCGRPKGFSENSLAYVRPLLATCSGILAARRQARMRQEAEDSLRRSEARWRFALEGNADGVWDYEVQNQRVFYSTVWKKMLGHEDSEISDSVAEWLERVHPDDIDRATAAFLEHFQKQNRTFAVEYRMRHKDGSYRWIRDRGMTMERGPDGFPMRVVGTHRDVTALHEAEAERRAMETQILQSQKLESMGILAGGIAHDFNNILTSIIGYADLALAEAAPSTALHSRLEHVILGARRAADLTRQLLAYSGKGQLVLKTMDLAELARETCELMEITLPQCAKLIQRAEEGIPAIAGDPVQVRQVLLNLVTNAVEALGSNTGTVTVHTAAGPYARENFTVMHAPEDPVSARYVYTEVSDTGCGMDAETIARIFDPFFSTKFTGRGLGLASALGIVRGHNGAILVRSEPGKGTTIRVLFPACASPITSRTNAMEAPPLPKATENGLALAADDEAALLGLADELLGRLGYRVIKAADGLEAMNAFREHVDDLELALLDVSMPGMDGTEVCQAIKRERPDLCVLLTSGYRDQLEELHGGSHGANGFIHKPFRIGEFDAAVHTALENARAKAE